VQPSFEGLVDQSTDGYFRHHFDDGLVYVSPGLAALAGLPLERLRSDCPRLHDLLHEDGQSELQAILDQLREKQSNASSAVLRLQRPDGGTVWVELFLVAAVDAGGQVVGVDGVARDVSEHLEVADLLSRRSLEQSALLDAQRVLLSTLNLDRSVERIVQQAKDLLDARHCALFLIDPETGQLHQRCEEQAGDDRIWEQSKSLIQWVTERGRSVRVGPFDQDGMGADLASALPGDASMLACPLQIGGTNMGALAVIGRTGQYSDHDIAFLEALSQVASLALANSRSYRAMEQLASIDGLTGAFNRRFLEVNLPAEVDRAQRMGYPISALMVDIDELKQINDRHGHVAGDQALMQVVDLVRRRIRETDWIARFGGDEFIVILPGCSLAHLESLANDLLAELRDRDVAGVEESLRAVSSIGAVCADGQGYSASELIEQVDQAECQAKSSGGNRIVLGKLSADPREADAASEYT
jgi:diguanylate cyclase (GGDEF)-like protein/PAS domain S-box-containing protein